MEEQDNVIHDLREARYLLEKFTDRVRTLSTFVASGTNVKKQKVITLTPEQAPSTFLSLVLATTDFMSNMCTLLRVPYHCSDLTNKILGEETDRFVAGYASAPRIYSKRGVPLDNELNPFLDYDIYDGLNEKLKEDRDFIIENLSKHEMLAMQKKSLYDLFDINTNNVWKLHFKAEPKNLVKLEQNRYIADVYKSSPRLALIMSLILQNQLVIFDKLGYLDNAFKVVFKRAITILYNIFHAYPIIGKIDPRISMNHNIFTLLAA